MSSTSSLKHHLLSPFMIAPRNDPRGLGSSDPTPLSSNYPPSTTYLLFPSHLPDFLASHSH
ncbi:hypothetical protein PCASD_22320 [Puccinia coronata f. sp. avenae]|uniref:Uncharacterized protein n=1 Tax=Puccinia coronata f. sp. avenae TaxID=200324 RepID=A0A2N5TW33_9BASI|nr:hypothetical protein PCASD_22320 [Puccinia coronata f. sp. avenae]